MAAIGVPSLAPLMLDRFPRNKVEKKPTRQVRTWPWSPSTIRILRVPDQDLACSPAEEQAPNLASNLLMT